MRTLLIDENGIMYWASLADIRDLRAGIRIPSTVLPSLERVKRPGALAGKWERREYVDFLCHTPTNEQKYTVKTVMEGGGFISAYHYLQRLFGFRTDVAAMIEGHKYIIPIADAVEYTLGLIDGAGLMRRLRMGDPALRNIDHYGVTNYLIVE